MLLAFVVIEMKEVEVNEFHPGPWAEYYMTILIEEYI
jgi:hypothetical protein